MDIKYTDSFKNALKNVLESFSSKEIECLEIDNLEKRYDLKDIYVVIGIVGDFSGNAYISMDKKTSIEIASEMLGGMEISEVDELVISAVGELGNMVMGTACSLISENNVKIDITPPTVILGEKVYFSNDVKIYKFPIKIKELGLIDLDITIRST